MTNGIDQRLIENALALTNTPMGEMEEDFYSSSGHRFYSKVTMSKFSYYLLSPGFIEKYEQYDEPLVFGGKENAMLFGSAIYQYQDGNSASLISLLEKIPGNSK